METIKRFDTIQQYNDYIGVETLHPLISVINLSESKPMLHSKEYFGFYTVFLKEAQCAAIHYGRGYYDYQKGTVLCVAPGQIIGIEDNGEEFQPMGWALLFHPDLIYGTSLGQNIKNYHFFSYESNEALHLSAQEREIFIDCVQKILLELNHSIDKHTNKLVARNIELLLDYCNRFYDRQFFTRSKVNKDILTRFENLLSDYYMSSKPMEKGIPSVKYCADKLNLSSNYFGDLIKKETGRSAKDFIQVKIIDIAKSRLFDSDKTVSEIAYELGFNYPSHFSKLFKNIVGVSPNEYRIAN